MGLSQYRANRGIQAVPIRVKNSKLMRAWLLFSDAEFGEDVAEDFVGGDLAGDLAEVVDGETDVEGYEFLGEAGEDGEACAGEGCTGILEGVEVADVGDDDFAGLVGVADACLEEGGLELVEALVVAGGEAEMGGGDVVRRGWKLVPFVADDDELEAVFAKFGEVVFEVLGGGGEDVVDIDQNLGFVDAGEGALDADGFDLVLGFADACGVHQAELDAVDDEGLFDGVTGGAWDVGDNGTLFLKKGVEEGGLACVGATCDDGEDAFFDGIAKAEAVDETVGDLLDALDHGEELVAVCKLYVLFREVEFQFEEGGKVEKFVAEAFDFGGHAAAHLLEGDGVGTGGGGSDEVGDGLCLCEVKGTVEEGSLGEFAREGWTGTVVGKEGKGFAQDKGAAMEGDFATVFPSK